MSETSTAELKDRIDAIEGGYEIFLGFAAKGLKGEPGTGGELRDCLQRMDLAMDGLGEFLLALVGERHLEPSLPYGRVLRGGRSGRPARTVGDPARHGPARESVARSSTT